MKRSSELKPSRMHVLVLLFLMQVTTIGCSLHFTRYTDGPLTDYVNEPIPRLQKPLARTMSLEKVMYLTAASMKARMISDMTGREIIFIPADVGGKVKDQLKLDDAFSPDATRAGLNTIAEFRLKARAGESPGAPPAGSSNAPMNASTERYIQRQEMMAKEAYTKGEYLTGNIHTSAASNAIAINQSFARAQATADLAFSVIGGMSAAGEALIKADFINLRNWIETQSGAIGPNAPEGSHLTVFFFQFFDAESFQFDSRGRLAVYLVLMDKNGKMTSVLEGSDILNCEGECNLFQPKPTAKRLDMEAQSGDIRKQLWTPEGQKYLTDNGFDLVSGIYQYVLLQHGLQKLSVQKPARGK